MAEQYMTDSYEMDDASLDWGVESPTADSYNQVDEYKAPVQTAGEDNIRMNAAYDALLESDPQKVLPRYQSTKEQLSQGKRSNVRQRAREVNEGIQADNMKNSSFYDLLANPEVPLQEKSTILNTLQNQKQSPREAYAEEQLVRPTEDETTVDADNRIDWISTFNEVTQEQMGTQRLYNDMVRDAEDSTTTSTLTEFLGGMIPFASSWQMDDVVEQMKEEGGELTRDLKNGFFLNVAGNKERLHEWYNSLTPDKQQEALYLIQKVVQDNGFDVDGEDDFLKAEVLSTTQQYNNEDAFKDTLFTAMDLVDVGVGSAAVSLGKRALKGKRTPKMFEKEIPTKELHEAALRDTRSDIVTGENAPASPKATADTTNPDTSRGLHQVIEKEPTGEAAKTLTGNTRDVAVASDVLPTTEKAFIKRKTPDPHAKVKEADALDALEDLYSREKGPRYLTAQEKAKARVNAFKTFKSANLGENWNSMSQVGIKDESTFVIKQVIGGGKDTGFRGTPEQITEAIKPFMKKNGKKLTDAKFFVKEGKDYTQVDSLMEVNGRETLVQFAHTFDYNPYDLGKQLQFGRGNVVAGLGKAEALLPAMKGKALNHLVAPEVLFDVETLVKQAAIGKDAVIRNVSKFKAGVEQVKASVSKLPKEERTAVLRAFDEAVQKADHVDSFKVDTTGFKPEQMDALNNLERYARLKHNIRNNQAVKDMKLDGYKEINFKTAEGVTQHKFFGKELRVDLKDSDNIMDFTRAGAPELVKGSLFKAENMAEAFTKAVIKLPTPVNFNGVRTSLIRVSKELMSDIDDAAQVLRFNPNENVLAKGQGNHFILDKDGVAVHAVRTKEEAKELIDSLNFRKEGDVPQTAKYTSRTGVNEEDVMRLQRELEASSGELAMTFNGKGLTDSSLRYVNSRTSFLDKMDNDVAYLSDKVAMGDTLSAFKQRWMNTYDELYSSKGLAAEKRFPLTFDEVPKGHKLSGEAGSSWAYINKLEHDLASNASLHWRNAMNNTNSVLSKLENTPVTDMARSTAFYAQIAGNPLRQGTLAVAELMKAGIVHPTYAPRLIPDMLAVYTYKLAKGKYNTKATSKALKKATRISGRSEEWIKQVVKEWDEYGTGKAADATALYHAGMRQEAINATSKVGKTLKKGSTLAFDAAENSIQLGTWLSKRNDALSRSRTGKLSAEELKDVAGETRLFTGNLGKAGEMAFQQSWVNLAFQYVNVPLKFMWQATGYGGKNPKLLAKMMGGYTVLYGTEFMDTLLPESVKTSINNIEDPYVRGTVKEGLSWLLFNTAFNELSNSLYDSHEDTVKSGETDISTYNLRPFSGDVFTDNFITVSLDEGVKAALEATPSSSVITKTYNIVSDYLYGRSLEGLDPVETSAVLQKVGELSSGYSNYTKAMIALDTREFVSLNTGKVADWNVSTPEAISKLFGFQTNDELMKYEANGKLYELTQESKADIDSSIDQLVRVVQMQHASESPVDPSQLQREARALMYQLNVWSKYPAQRKYIQSRIKKKFEDKGEDGLYHQIRKQVGYVEADELKSVITNTNLEESTKEHFVKYIDSVTPSK